MEEVTLIKSTKGGEILVLHDGRRLNVNPEYIPTAVLWLPTSILEVSDYTAGGAFNLTVTRQGTSEQIRARWR
jgi:hypothetical protein